MPMRVTICIFVTKRIIFIQTTAIKRTRTGSKSASICDFDKILSEIGSNPVYVVCTVYPIRYLCTRFHCSVDRICRNTMEMVNRSSVAWIRTSVLPLRALQTFERKIHSFFDLASSQATHRMMFRFILLCLQLNFCAEINEPRVDNHVYFCFLFLLEQ